MHRMKQRLYTDTQEKKSPLQIEASVTPLLPQHNVFHCRFQFFSNKTMKLALPPAQRGTICFTLKRLQAAL